MSERKLVKIPVGCSKHLWKNWAEIDGEELVAMGIPREVVSDPLIWEDFVEHGLVAKHRDVIDFEYEQIAPEHYPQLLEILLHSYPPCDHPLYDLILVLWRLVKPNEPFWE
ncbi:MAG: hypothetical protein ACK4UN_05800 [Limisphaerales bacterium]